jgi:hypothetical protein
MFKNNAVRTLTTEQALKGKKGVWRVIEPQSPESLKNMYTRFYLPVTRARFLEDKNVKTVDLSLQLLALRMAIRPAE